MTLVQTGEGSVSTAVVVPLAVTLAAVHVVASRLRFLDVIPRSRLLSLSGGASVAYVFVHMLPELEASGGVLEPHLPALAAVEHHVYLLTLCGFVTYYGLEQFAKRSSGRDESSPPQVFWLHVSSFALYNGLVGYLLVHRETGGRLSLFLFTFAMGLHFLVNDYGLNDHHETLYRQRGRWLLAVAVLAGTAVGATVTVSELLTSALFAFLAGGVVLNVIKEELPAERESQFWAFALGATLYAGLLLVI